MNENNRPWLTDLNSLNNLADAVRDYQANQNDFYYKQRVFLALAMAEAPEKVFFDEEGPI